METRFIAAPSSLERINESRDFGTQFLFLEVESITRILISDLMDDGSHNASATDAARKILFETD